MSLTSACRRWRIVLPPFLIAALVAGTCPLSAAHAADGGSPDPAAGPSSSVIGSFDVGGMRVAIDSRTGALSASVTIATLPGRIGSGSSVSLGLSYSQDLVGTDRNRGGSGWTWNGPSITLDAPGGSARFYPGAGRFYEVDNSARNSSGLLQYPGKDAVFERKAGELPAVDRTPAMKYAYVFSRLDAPTEYFNANGDRVAAVDLHGNQTTYEWAAGHELKTVTDSAGNRIAIRSTSHGLRVEAPSPVAGKIAATELTLEGGVLVGLRNPVNDETYFRYSDDTRTLGFLESIVTPSGAVTSVAYQTVPTKSLPGARQDHAVKSVAVTDGRAGPTLLSRSWNIVGDHTATGAPTFSSASKLWGSGASYHYTTSQSDGRTRVESRYSSLGLLVRQRFFAGTSDRPERERTLSYEGSDDTRVPAPDKISPVYDKPLTTSMVEWSAAGKSCTSTDSLSYDAFGRLVSQKTSLGTTTITRYDDIVPAGRVLPVGLPLEQRTSGDDGLVSEVRNSLSANRTRIVRAKTRSGKSGEMRPLKAYDFTNAADGFLTSQRIRVLGELLDDAGADPRTVTFDRAIGNGAVVIATTNAAGASAQSTTKTTTDSATGLVTSSTDAVGRVSTTQYDVSGRPLSQVDGSGLVTTTTYEKVERGSLTRVAAPDGVVRSTYADVLGRLTKTVDNIENGVPVAGYARMVLEQRYEEGGARVVARDAFGAETTTVTDSQGRVVSVAGPVLTTFTEYDDFAKTVRSGVVPNRIAAHGLSAAEKVTTQTMDEKSRRQSESVSRTDGVSQPAASVSRDSLGRVTSQSFDDVTAETVFNADGTPKRTVRTPTNPEFPAAPMNADRRFAPVFAQAVKTTLSQAGSVPRDGGERKLDAAGRVYEETDQAGGVTRTSYTPDGLVATVRATAGSVTENRYDAKTRQLVRTTKTGADGSKISRCFEFDSLTGRLISVYDPSDTIGSRISYSYDALGNITRVAYPDGKTITHLFDPAGRKTESTDIAGNLTCYRYDEQTGALILATQSRGDVPLAGVHYSYDDYQRLSAIERDNGVKTQFTFTSADEIAHETTTRGTETVFEASYVYDSHGNVSRSTQSREKNDPGTLETQTRTYRYDGFNRLIASQIFDGSSTDANSVESNTYALNVSGDVTRRSTVRGNETTVRDFGYNALGQLLSIKTNGVEARQEFDQSGNLRTSADGTQYAYDSANQLISQTPEGAPTTNYAYWPTGERARATTGNSSENLYWDGGELVNEDFTSEGATAGYTLGATRDARVITRSDGSARADYYLTDRHGSTTATVGTKGKVTNTYSYDDYGLAKHSSGPVSGVGRNPIQYSGEYTTERGLQPLGARNYDPQTMRFTTKDTAELHNRYAYANNNPLTMSDPSGHTSEADYFSRALVSTTMTWMSLGGLAAAEINPVASPFVSIAFIAATILNVVATGYQVARGLSASGEDDPLSRGLSIASTTVTMLAVGGGILDAAYKRLGGGSAAAELKSSGYGSFDSEGYALDDLSETSSLSSSSSQDAELSRSSSASQGSVSGSPPGSPVPLRAPQEAADPEGPQAAWDAAYKNALEAELTYAQTLQSLYEEAMPRLGGLDNLVVAPDDAESLDIGFRYLRSRNSMVQILNDLGVQAQGLGEDQQFQAASISSVTLAWDEQYPELASFKKCAENAIKREFIARATLLTPFLAYG